MYKGRDFKGLFIDYIDVTKEIILKKSLSNLNEKEGNFTECEDVRKELLKEAKKLSIVKDNLELIFENAWVDIFQDIISFHQEYFYNYFSESRVNKFFKDCIREPFIWIMVLNNTIYESNVLNDTKNDILIDGNGKSSFTKVKLAKQYYLTIKLVHPILAKTIFDEAVDGYHLEVFSEGYGVFRTYSSLFNTLKTRNGKCSLITKVINNIRIEGYKIDITPVLNNDLILIFESCLKSRDFELISFIGGYIEYLINFSKDEATINFKNKIIELLNKYDNIPEVHKFRRSMYFE